MQHNKHFATQNFRQTFVISHLVQPGWSPGIMVCLSASGICNIINILGEKILGKRCNILSGSPRLESWHHCMPRHFFYVFVFFSEELPYRPIFLSFYR